MTTIDAIETSYAGHRFRSRLEARWAVAFDRMGTSWVYEPQGYEIDVAGTKRNYLPDFWLPEAGVWCEVKGSPEGLDLPLLAYAAHPEGGLPDGPEGGPARLSPGHRLLILGPVPQPQLMTVPLHCVFTSYKDGPLAGVSATGALFFGNVVLGTELSVPVLDLSGNFYVTKTDLWPRVAGEDTLPLAMAVGYQAARSARFEHGESGAA